jgi:hypothetical protein
MTLGFMSCIGITFFDFLSTLSKAEECTKRKNQVTVLVMIPIIAILIWLSYFTDFSQRIYAILSIVFFGSITMLLVLAIIFKKKTPKN